MFLSNDNAFLSEGGGLSVVVKGLSRNAASDAEGQAFSASNAETAKRGCASRVPLPPGAAARRTRGVLVEGATPPF